MSESPLSVNPVDRTPRLSDVVSDQLLAAIREAHLPAGAKLPSERDLGEQFGVSRTVIREAVRHLAAKGILEVQSGSGARVAELNHSGVTDALALFLRRRGPLDPDKIDEVRQTIELEVVRLAAVRATDEDLAAIHEACESAGHGDPESVAVEDVKFHRAIAAATDNELFLVLLDSISDVMMEIRRATVSRPGRIKVGLEQHRRIVEALERRDIEGAVSAMQDHLVDSRQAFQRTLKTRAKKR